MLIATAGHIDHGKTSLIKALTGADTDRLPEEKSRGISIDIGFAYWTTAQGETIGFVDVPGHERYVRNMLAGVGAVDFALLVVAADDGIMPQTVEHVQILDQLGVSEGIVAITKCDRTSAERIAAVRRDAMALLAPTCLGKIAVVEVSATTGAGVPELATMLARTARATQRDFDPRRGFRLAIDRAFSVTGAGTVVTGTVVAGAVETGARLSFAPKRIDVRVRGLQSAGRPVDRVRSGERCALNLAGVDVGQIDRGDWLVASDLNAPTTRIEARIAVVPECNEPLRHYAAVHLHHGTARIGARVLIPSQGAIEPGQTAVAQLALDAPTSAVAGERFVIRDQSGRHTLGGGRVIDPFATRERRRGPSRAPLTAALDQPTPRDMLVALLAIPGHELDTAKFRQALNLLPEAARDLYRDADAVLLGKSNGIALAAPHVAALRNQIIATLTTFHQDHPEAKGLALRDLRRRLAIPPSLDVLHSITRALAEEQAVDLGGSLVKLAGHASRLVPFGESLWRDLTTWHEERGVLFFTIDEAIRALGSSEAALKALLHRRRLDGDIWRFADRYYVLRGTLAALAQTAEKLGQPDDTGFTAGHFRDATGIGRNMVIRLLEFFDEIGVTRRLGNRRLVRPDYPGVLGLIEACPELADQAIETKGNRQ